MISSIVSQVCTSIQSQLTAIPIFGSTIASFVASICTQIVSLFQSLGL